MPRISRNENDDTNRVSSDILHTSQQMGCSNLWARLKIMCHVRQPIYHTRYSLPLRVATRFNGVAVKSKRNKSESPAVSRSFVRQHPLPRPVSSAQLPASSTENRGHNPGQDILVSFRKFVLRETFPVCIAMRLFVIHRGYMRDARRFVEEGCTEGRLYFE